MSAYQLGILEEQLLRYAVNEANGWVPAEQATRFFGDAASRLVAARHGKWLVHDGREWFCVTPAGELALAEADR